MTFSLGVTEFSRMALVAGPVSSQALLVFTELRVDLGRPQGEQLSFFGVAIPPVATNTHKPKLIA